MALFTQSVNVKKACVCQFINRKKFPVSVVRFSASACQLHSHTITVPDIFASICSAGFGKAAAGGVRTAFSDSQLA